MQGNASDFLSAIGVLFFMFFVIAAATEAILETFRGLLERFGFTFLKAEFSLDEAIRLSTEFLPDDAKARGKVVALQQAVARVDRLASKKAVLDKLVQAIDTSNNAIDTGLTTAVNRLTVEIKEELDKNERNRVFVLRLLAAAIGAGLAWLAGIDAVAIMEKAFPGITQAALLKELGWLLTGIAAAGGSSYWHDKLDKVRNLKGLQDELRRLAS